MKKNLFLSDAEYNTIIEDFYNYFEDGYKFEEFLKVYLEKIGLDEVFVTQRSRDGGIDLVAIRNGIGDLGGQDIVKYCIQAKRYKPSNNVDVRDVRALGYVASTHKSVGIFITTAKFSKNTYSEFSDPNQNPIILIDGKSLVNSCIDNELGFIYKPVFNKQTMDKLMLEDFPHSEIKKNVDNAIVVEKNITANDIRARILSIPRVILDNISKDKDKINVSFNNEYSKELSINKGRNYLAGITEVYKKYGLISDDGTINPATATWVLKNGNLDINIVF